MLSRRAAQRARNHYQPTCNSSSIVCSSVSTALSCSDNDFVTFTQEPDDGQPPSCSTYTDDIINGCGVGLSSSKSKLVQWVDDVNDGLCSPVVVGKSSTGKVDTAPEPILKKMQIVPPPESPQPEYISFNVSNSTKGNVAPHQTQPPVINKQCEHLVAIEVEDDDTTASLSSQSNDDDSDMTDVTTNNNGLSPKIYAYYTTSPAAIAAKAADEEKRKEIEMNQNCFTVLGLIMEPLCSGAIFDTKYCGCEQPFGTKDEEEEEVVISCVPHWCKDNYTEDGKIVVEVSDDEVSQEDKAATESDVVKADQVDEVVVFEDGDMMMLNDIQDLKATVATEEPQEEEEDVPTVLERDMMLDELEVQEAIVKEEDPQEQEDDDDESDTPSIWSVDNSDGEECINQEVNASPLAAMGAASTIVSSMMNSSPSDEKVDNEDDMLLDVEDGVEAVEEELQEEKDAVVEDEDMMVNESQDEIVSSQEIDNNSNVDDMTDSDMYEALLEWE